MTTSDQTHQPTQIVDDVEVIKDLEQRGIHGLEALSLQELELLAERKRKLLHQEAVDRKAHLEGEITRIGAQIQQLQTTKEELETQLRVVAKSLGLAGGGPERTARRNPRKSKKPEAPDVPSTPEA